MSAEQLSPGITFLHERNQRFHQSPEVSHVVGYLSMHGTRVSQRPAERIGAYLDFMADPEYANDGILTSDDDSLRRQVMQTVDHGLPKDPEDPDKVRTLRINQLMSLLPWALHLGENKQLYPNWFRYYAFEAVKKLGPYSDVAGYLCTRSNDTEASYPELHEGALSTAYELLSLHLEGRGVNGDYDDPEQERLFQQALRTGSFRRLYKHGLLTHGTGSITPQMRERTEGAWVTYPQWSDAGMHFRDTQGFGLEWCTSAGYGDALNYIDNGDLHTYFTKDTDDKIRVPRIAMYAKDGEIKEVRGIGPEQELEPALVPILNEKLRAHGGGERFITKGRDLVALDALAQTLKQRPDKALNDTEMTFLYELRRDIDTFGHDRPPAITELRRLRRKYDSKSLRKLLPEAFRGQLGPAYEAYCEAASTVGQRPVSNKQMQRLFREQNRDWRRRGVYDYAATQMIEGEHTYNMVITPNVPAPFPQILLLFHSLAYDLDIDFTYNEEFYNREPYSATELSGNYGTGPVRFSLIPSRLDEMRVMKSSKEGRTFDVLRYKYPRIRLTSPSILEGICYWRTLRAAGNDPVKTHAGHDRTDINHVAMRPVVLPTSDKVSVAPYMEFDTYTSEAQQLVLGCQVADLPNVRLSLS